MKKMNKKTVAIGTWVGNRSLNYGSMFQSTAMQELIRAEGYKALTVNYMGNAEKVNMRERKKIDSTPVYIHGKKYALTKYKFDRFARKHLKLTMKCYTKKDVVSALKNRADILLTGSDAVWKQKWLCPLFTWDYPDLTQPAIAYAPSMTNGVVNYPFERILKRYVAISGRERVVGELLSPFTDKKVETVLDPTLTVTPDFWKRMSRKRLIDESYVLCYILSCPEYSAISAEEIRMKHHAEKVVFINTDWIDKGRKCFSMYAGNDYKKIVGPEEFIELIHFAEAVCTDSFHGMCMSIVFEKDFYLFSREGDLGIDWDIRKDYRFIDYEKRLGLGDRIVTANSHIEEMEPIDYTVVNEFLIQERKCSQKYLHDALTLASENRIHAI